MFTVISFAGIFEQVNVNAPFSCAEQYTPLLPYITNDAGAGDTMMSSSAEITDDVTLCVLLLDHPATLNVTLVANADFGSKIS